MKPSTSLAVGSTALVLVACLIPGAWLRAESRMSVGVSHLDKLVHGVLFAQLAWSWMRAGGGRHRAAWVLGAGAALAVLTELAQGLPAIARDPDPLDALADVAGLLVGLAARRGRSG